MGRPSKNPLRPAPGSIALISPQQYLMLSGNGPAWIVKRLLEIWKKAPSGVPPPPDRKALEKLFRGEATRRIAKRFVEGWGALRGELPPDLLAYFEEMKAAVATEESWKAFNQPRTGLVAVEVELDAGDWQMFREYWLPKPNPADGRNADFFASHLLPMQDASFKATRLAVAGKYAEAIQTLERSPIGPYVEWQPMRDALPTIRDAADFSNRIAPARLLSILFVLAVLEQEHPHQPGSLGSLLVDFMPSQSSHGRIKWPFRHSLDKARDMARASPKQERDETTMLGSNPDDYAKKARQRFGSRSRAPSLPAFVTVFRELAELRRMSLPKDKRDGKEMAHKDFSEGLYRDLHLLTEFGRVVSQWPHSLHPDGFNGFFGMYRTMYDDLGRGERHGGLPLPCQL